MIERYIMKFGRWFAFLNPVTSSWKKMYRLFYTGYITKEFKKFGFNSRIEPHCNLLVGSQYISVGSNSYLGRGIQLTAWDNYETQLFSPSIEIGDNCQIGDYAHITAINSIILGNNVLTGKFLLVTDNSHGLTHKNEIETSPVKRPLYSKGPVVIEDNVWLGDKVSIMPDVRIGKGSIIAAGSIVTRDVAPYSLVGGNPAKLIRSLL